MTFYDFSAIYYSKLLFVVMKPPDHKNLEMIYETLVNSGDVGCEDKENYENMVNAIKTKEKSKMIHIQQ